jgi:hypothetical protein
LQDLGGKGGEKIDSKILWFPKEGNTKVGRTMNNFTCKGGKPRKLICSVRFYNKFL